MADLGLDDGSSAWGDQVSLSNNNSSSSSLASPPAAKRANPLDAQLVHEDATVRNPHDSKLSSSTPALSSPRRTSRTALRGRKAKLSQSVQVENDAGDGPLGPLGPLGEGAEAVTSSALLDKKDSLDDVPLHSDVERGLQALRVSPEERQQLHPPREGAQFGSSHEPAVKANVVEQAPEKFEVTVGDPIKVGDITSAHTVYTVLTNTTHKDYEKKEMSVTRRYRDFRWVYHALEDNNPGMIVPPPPDKQAMGRFNEDFVEARRTALENMLTKIAAHPVLQNDPDFRLFLASEQFSHDIKHRTVIVHDDEHRAASKSSGGFMSSLGFSFSSKYIETSDWFISKKKYLDNLQAQLKSLAKALELVVTQRRELSESTGEFAAVLETLSSVEISKSLQDLLGSFANAQYRIKDLYSRQCMQDILSLAATLDEYVRLISSIRSVFVQRQKAFINVQSAEQELSKRRQHLDKLNRQGRTLQDKIAAVTQEVDDQEKHVVDLRVVFDDISKTIMHEFDRFEHEKVRDFRNSVELFLENAVEAQKEAIEIWETFYRTSGFTQASHEAESPSKSPAATVSNADSPIAA